MPRRLPSRRLTLAAAIFAFAAAAAVPGAAHAQTLLNGSFEAVDASAPPFYLRSPDSTPGWTQIGDGVDLLHNNYEQPTLPVLVDASDGVQFLDLNQLGALGGVEQVVGSVIAGATYRLQLDATAWATNSIGGTIGYALFDPTSNLILASGSFTDNVGGTWTTLSLDAVATSDQIGVRIQGLAAQQAGMGLDNVRLNAVTAVPEASSLWLAALGIALLGLPLARCRRAPSTAVATAVRQG